MSYTNNFTMVSPNKARAIIRNCFICFLMPQSNNTKAKTPHKIGKPVLIILNLAEETLSSSSPYVSLSNSSVVKKSTTEEYLILTSSEDFYLDIKHVNSWFNCSPGQIIVDASLEGNNISINEYSTDNSANCVCPYDLSYMLGPLQYRTYNLIVKREGFEVLNVEIEFKKNLDMRLDIGNGN